MPLTTILVIILIVLLLGGGGYGFSNGWGYGSAVPLIVAVILVALLLRLF